MHKLFSIVLGVLAVLMIPVMLLGGSTVLVPLVVVVFVVASIGGCSEG